MSYSYTLDGREVVISDEEVAAIEVSGRSSLDRYIRNADTLEPIDISWYIRNMGMRPSAVPPGERPVQPPPPPAVKQIKNRTGPVTFHLRVHDHGYQRPVCGKKANHLADICGEKKFHRILHETKAKICEECALIYIRGEHK